MSFGFSEPLYLLSCLNAEHDWLMAVGGLGMRRAMVLCIRFEVGRIGWDRRRGYRRGVGLGDWLGMRISHLR